MVLEAVEEDGDGGGVLRQPRTLRRSGARPPIRPDHKVGPAGDRHTVPYVKVHLRLHEILVAADRQGVAGLAPHLGAVDLDRGRIRRCRTIHRSGAARRRLCGLLSQRLDEPVLQFALGQDVGGDAGQPLHDLQLRPALQSGRHQPFGRLARRGGHVAAPAVGEDAPVAAVLLRVPDAGALAQRRMRRLEDRAQLVGVGHAVLQIAGPPGHGVVQQQVPSHSTRLGDRIRALHRAQVSDLAAELAPQSQVQRGHERVHVQVRCQSADSGHKHPNRLRLELPIQVDALGGRVGARAASSPSHQRTGSGVHRRVVVC